MKRIRTIILLIAMMLVWTMNAQVDTIVTASGELGNSNSDLEFLNESGELTNFPRLSDVGELLYYPPLVTTDSVTNITRTSAMVYGNILFNGWYGNVLEQGFQLSTTADFSGSVTTQSITPENPYADCELPCMENVYSFTFTGLTPATIYYVRAYATNSVGTAYGEEKSFTTTLQDGDPCSGTHTLTDIDGNTYNTVQIGTQCWMKENLRTTKYADDTPITQGSETAYWYYPNDAASNKPTYGLLYNWKAVMRNATSSSANPSGVQGICPTGWHVPSDAEWTQLTDYVSSQSQYGCDSNNTYIAKALASTTGWNSTTTTCAVGNTLGDNNATDFSALPAGYYDHGGTYSYFGNNAYFWSATENNSSVAYNRYFSYDNANVYRLLHYKHCGFSMRCVRDELQSITISAVTTASVSDITSTTATCGGNVTDDGGATITARGVCWSTNSNPTISDDHTTNGNGIGSFTSSLTNLTPNTTYYVRAYATNSGGTSYGNEVNFTTSNPNDGQPCPNTPTLTDVDGNTYNTVQIGTQCWMKENLRTTKYANNTSIAQGNDTSTTTAYWYYPNDDATNKPTYGLLYNWKAVIRDATSSSANPSGVQGICPIGWHVPSDAEWTQLTDYVSSQSQYVCGSDNMSIVKALAATTVWRSDTNTCVVGNTPSNNNATGFSVLPAGYYCGYYLVFSYNAYFWSATESSRYYVYGRTLSYRSAYVGRTNDSKYYSYSVRCVKDVETAQDGDPCPGTPTLTDIDGNTYNTVLIGSQCWMRENLRTTKYADNTPISQGSDTSTIIAYWYYPKDDASNKPTYGLLYNWKAVMCDATSSSANPSGVKGICPIGWHVPSHAEWTQLTDYVGNQSQYVCGSENTSIAKALAFTTGWENYTGTCAVGNTPADNNATGFSALPAGQYFGPFYAGFGTHAYFWSATETTSGSAYTRSLIYNYTSVYHSTDYYGVKYGGFSVRCIKDAETVQGGNPCPGTPILTDIDGNTYNTVQIGTQCWMKENLRTTKYADNTPIAQGSESSTTTAYWYYPNDDASNKPTYGLLYNWKAVMGDATSSNANPSGVQGICPNGWHMPSDAEWKQMEMAVGMSQSDADNTGYRGDIAARLCGNTGWTSSSTANAAGNTSAAGRNSSGFSALPTGDYSNGSYYFFGINVYFWSTTDDPGVCIRVLNYNNVGVTRSYSSKTSGFSVRCVRD